LGLLCSVSLTNGFINNKSFEESMEAEIEIAGHANEWVALVGNQVVASSKSFGELVKKLQSAKLEKKATVTRVSGTFSTL